MATTPPAYVRAETAGMQAVDAVRDPEPWATRLQPPHPEHVARAAGALITVTRSLRHAYQIAYTLDDVGLLAR